MPFAGTTPSLAELLVKLWDREVHRLMERERLIERRAAQRQLEHWPEPPDESAYLKPPDAATLAADREQESSLKELCREIADGKKFLVQWGWLKPDLSAYDQPEWARMGFGAWMLEVRSELWSEERQRLGPNASKLSLWEFAVQEIVKVSQVAGINAEMLAAYAERWTTDNLDRSDVITAELARLDAGSFAERFVVGIVERFPKDAAELGVAAPPSVGPAKPIRAAIAAIEASPGTDDSVFRPASELCRERFANYGKCKRFLEKHPEIRTKRPRPNRLKIHAGDWAAHWAKADATAFDSLDKTDAKPLTDVFIEGVEERLAAIQQAKKTRKFK